MVTLRSRVSVFRQAIVLALLLATAPVLRAAEGRTPIFSPTTIVSDGKYIVTRDIGPAAVAIITISSPNVDIDLNGFTLDNSGTPNPVIVAPGPVESLTIRNGTLRGGAGGIDVPFPSPAKVVLQDLKIQAPSGFGIHLVNPLDLLVRFNLIESPAATGIQVDPAPIPTSGTIEGNVVRGGAGDGIRVSNSSALAIVQNRVDQVAGVGIALAGGEGCLVTENTVERAGQNGIDLATASGCKLYDNVVRTAKFHGIHLDPGSNDNLVTLSTVTGCGAGLPGGHGLFVEGNRNVLERNTLNSNNGAGLRLAAGSSNNSFGRNAARGNTGVALGPCAGAPALFPPNSCNDGVGNTTFGDNLIPGPPVF